MYIDSISSGIKYDYLAYKASGINCFIQRRGDNDDAGIIFDIYPDDTTSDKLSACLNDIEKKLYLGTKIIVPRFIDFLQLRLNVGGHDNLKRYEFRAHAWGEKEGPYGIACAMMAYLQDGSVARKDIDFCLAGSLGLSISTHTRHTNADKKTRDQLGHELEMMETFLMGLVGEGTLDRLQDLHGVNKAHRATHEDKLADYIKTQRPKTYRKIVDYRG